MDNDKKPKSCDALFYLLLQNASVLCFKLNISQHTEGNLLDFMTFLTVPPPFAVPKVQEPYFEERMTQQVHNLKTETRGRQWVGLGEGFPTVSSLGTNRNEYSNPCPDCRTVW